MSYDKRRCVCTAIARDQRLSLAGIMQPRSEQSQATPATLQPMTRRYDAAPQSGAVEHACELRLDLLYRDLPHALVERPPVAGRVENLSRSHAQKASCTDECTVAPADVARSIAASASGTVNR